MSAHPKERLIEMGRMDPGFDSLEKPISSYALLSKVKKVLAKAEAR